MTKTKMQLTRETGTEFWNDSCDPEELREAVSQGAVGATSNPVIVTAIYEKHREHWQSFVKRVLAEAAADSEEDIAWKLIVAMGREAADLLRPVYEKSGGRQGRLSIQVNPKFYRDAGRMEKQAAALAESIPNVAIKVPAIAAGLEAAERLTARGISVTVTVSFTVAQALAAAEAVERGLAKAADNGIDVARMSPSVVIMIGRLDDHLRRVMEKERISIDPGCLEWAGVAVSKRVYGLFCERRYRSRLLVAAYRNHMHWSEFVGGRLALSMPYKWWRQFNASGIEVIPRIERPVAPAVVAALSGNFEDFRRAYEPDGMQAAEFVSYGASIHTLQQFMANYDKLLGLIRQQMLA